MRAFEGAWRKACGPWSRPSSARTPWPAWPWRWCATRRSSRAGSASATSAAARRSHPRRCSTWPRCPSPSSRPAVVSLATARDAGEPLLDLDAPITDWVPEFSLADGRAGEVTARGLLSHTSGLPDVAEYGWHDPQLGDDALSEFACSLSDWRLQAEPGSTYSYSNAGYRASRAAAVPGHGHDVRERDPAAGLDPARDAEQHLPARRGARAPGCLTARRDAAGGARGRLSLHPAPCPQLDACTPTCVEMCRWMVAHFAPAEVAAGVPTSSGPGWTPGCST